MTTLSFARGGGGDDAIPPNSETSNKVLLPEAEESTSTPSATTLLDTATVEAIRSGTFLAVSVDTPLPFAPLEVTVKSSRPALMPAFFKWMLPLRVWSTVAAIAAAIYQWIRALPLWSPVAAVVADALRPLLIHVAGFAGHLLSLRPSWVESLPRPFRCASPRSFGGDSAVLAAKRGERPPTGARLGGGGGTSSTTASGADESPDSDTPKAAAASAVPDPISAALHATGSAVDMLLHTAQAPALTMQLLYVSVLLASVVIVVDAERVRNSPRENADGTDIEHAIDVARPSDHQIEETQTKGEETVGKLIRSKPRS